MRKSLYVWLVALLILPLVQMAEADIIGLQGVNYPSTISGIVDFSYVPTGASSGEIDVTLWNTSAVRSSLTGFAFNAPSNVTGVSSIDGAAGWDAIYDPDGINTPGRFGFFDIAAITGPSFNGGKPAEGIWDGHSDSFVIYVLGTGMNSLTTASFLTLLSDLDGKSGTQENFIARYQAIGWCDGSDVAIPTSAVPEPATMLLLGSGLAGFAFIGRRREKQ